MPAVNVSNSGAHEGSTTLNCLLMRQPKCNLILGIEPVIRPAAITGAVRGKADVAILERVTQLLALFLTDISDSDKPQHVEILQPQQRRNILYISRAAI